MRTFAFPTNKALKTNQYANSCASLLVGTAALLGLGSVMTGCKKAEETPAALVSVQAERVEQKNLTEYVVGDAVLAPLAQSALVPKISAPVKKFLVQRGAHVKQGQLLAVLENADLAASVTDSKGSLTQAQAAFDTSIKAQIPEDKQKAQLDVAQTKAQMELAKTTMDARKSLLDQGAIPRRDYETAAAIYVQAKAGYDIAEHHLNSLNSVSQQASIDSAKGALVSAKGKYAAAAAGLGYSEIRSPIDGVITDRPLFAGEMAQAGSPILTVMDTSSLIAKVHLSQAQVGIMKVGAPALLMIPGMDAPQNATVSLVSPALDAGSTTLEVWVKIANRNGALKAGTPVHVKIAKQTLHDVLTVPNEAVVASKTGEPAVMVIESDGAAKSTPVKTGITDGTDTQIVTGIKQGDQVVTTGAYGMDDGTKVKVVAKGAADDDDAKPGTKPAAGDKD
jgi:multidrug efflux pump subunit AcrA (membrane-fusion protein)